MNEYINGNGRKEMFNFFILGCEYAKLCKKNILYYDFHKKNILFSDDGNFGVVDCDDMQIVNFPEEIDKYANAVINLYLNFGIQFGAAFRYGFICEAGEVGEVLYDIMYNQNELTCLKVVNKLREINTKSKNLVEIYEKWNELIDNSFVKEVTGQTNKYLEFSFIELMSRNSELYDEFKKKYRNNRDMMKHEYQVYFANAFNSENIFDLVGSAITLCQIEFLNHQYFLAAYYLTLAREEMITNEDCLDSLKEDFDFSVIRFINKFGEDEVNRLLKYVFHEVIRLRIQKGVCNVFYEIWYWSDFSKEHQIEDFILERLFGCYKCLDCKNIDFFDNDLDKCESCGSENLRQISFEEYMDVKMNQIQAEENENSDIENPEDTYAIDSIPELDTVDLIPVYIQMISSYEQKGDYDNAIDLAIRVENFLKNNPEICDEKGYIIENGCSSPKVFYSTITPNSLFKWFLDKTDSFKNDYESYISYKLCSLYTKKNDDIMALKYANIIIELANNSPRWLRQQYIYDAYSVKKSVSYRSKNKEDTLKYSNLIFIYDMLDKIDNNFQEYSDNSEISGTIKSLMNIGCSNSYANNTSIAYSCYMLALRIHIYHYGIRHPDTAIIYYNLGKLFAKKKLYEETYAHFGISLSMLEESRIERYKKQIIEIESTVSKCILEFNYKGSLNDWKKEWINNSAFNIFPERRFEKKESNKNSMPKMNMSKEELFDEFIVYYPY